MPVSPITVSRALRGERAVDPVLVERVRAAAQALGYVPDPTARALASRHSSQVVVLIPMLSNALFVDVLEAVQRTQARRLPMMCDPLRHQRRRGAVARAVAAPPGWPAGDGLEATRPHAS